MQIGLSDEPYDVLRYHHREFIPHNQTREDWNLLKEDHFPDPDEWLSTCPLNRNDVLRIAPRVRPIFFHSGHVIGSGDMCHQIKHVRFFEKMSFSQLRGSPEKVGGHIFM